MSARPGRSFWASPMGSIAPVRLSNYGRELRALECNDGPWAFHCRAPMPAVREGELQQAASVSAGHDAGVPVRRPTPDCPSRAWRSSFRRWFGPAGAALVDIATPNPRPNVRDVLRIAVRCAPRGGRQNVAVCRLLLPVVVRRRFRRRGLSRRRSRVRVPSLALLVCPANWCFSACTRVIRRIVRLARTGPKRPRPALVWRRARPGGSRYRLPRLRATLRSGARSCGRSCP